MIATSEDFMAVPTGRPIEGDSWGHWVYNEKNLTLNYKKPYEIYEVDLERCTTSAAILDWIFQIRMHDYSVADFVEAIHDLLDPQRNYCSGGLSGGGRKAGKFAVTKWLRRPRKA